MEPNLLGVGIYSVSQVSKLLGLPYSTVRNWVSGYKSQIISSSSYRVQKPVTKLMIPDIENKTAVTFINLIELLFVKIFKKHKISLQRIRLASKRAEEIIKKPHPFAYYKFATDEKTIYMSIDQGSKDTKLIELTKKQYCFKTFLDKYLNWVKFDSETKIAKQLWPFGQSSCIVLDPLVVFGSPSIAGTRIKTDVIYDVYESGNSISEIAEWYNLEEYKVQSAIEFENKLKMKKVFSDEIFNR